MNDRHLGYAVITLLALLAVAAISYTVWKLTYPFDIRHVRFDQIGSLRLQDPVRIDGVPSGIITEVTPTDDGVLVTIRSDRSFTVYEGYQVKNVDRGLMGDRLVTVETGDPTRPALARTDTLNGTFLPGPSEWIGAAGRLEEGVKELKGIADDLLHGSEENPPLAETFWDIALTVDTLTDRVFATTNRLDALLSVSLDSLQSIVGTTESLVSTVSSRSPQILDETEAQIADIMLFVARLDTLATNTDRMLTMLKDPDNALVGTQLKQLTTGIHDVQMILDDILAGATRLRLLLSLLRE